MTATSAARAAVSDSGYAGQGRNSGPGDRHFGGRAEAPRTVREAAARARGLRAANARPARSRSGRTFAYHGRTFRRFEVARYRWPRGYAYRRYAVGAYLPAVYWSPNYFIEDYGYYGLGPPPTDFEWIRYGPDIALIDLNSGAIAQLVYGAFDESDQVPFDGDPDQLPGDGPPPDDNY